MWFDWHEPDGQTRQRIGQACFKGVVGAVGFHSSLKHFTMICFKHPSASAIGLCKTCFKAVCPACAVDVGNGLACQGECEQKVRELNAMWDKAAKIYDVGPSPSRWPSSGVVFAGLLAVLAWVVVAVLYLRAGKLDVSLSAIAVFLTAAWGQAYLSARRTGIKT